MRDDSILKKGTSTCTPSDFNKTNAAIIATNIGNVNDIVEFKVGGVG